MAGLILCASAHGISKTASALRSSVDSVPYCFYHFVDVYKLDFLFRNYSIRFVCVAGRVVKEKGEPRGGNDHGAFPLVSLGQMRAAGCTHDPRFPRSVLN